jgi:hypothetical protein
MRRGLRPPTPGRWHAGTGSPGRWKTRAELAELFAHVAANLFINYFNHYAQTEPDLPAAPGLEGWSPLD